MLKRKINILNVFLYTLFLVPISTSGEETISINYLFILLAINPKRYVPNKEISLYVYFLLISLTLGIIIYSQFESNFVFRQTISFVLYFFGIILTFLRLRFKIEELIYAIVLVSVLYSLYAIGSIVLNGFSLSDIYFIKSGLRTYINDWPQRFVIVLVFAEIICISKWYKHIIWQSAAIIILICIFLTFTRAAWLSLILGLIVFLYFKNKHNFAKYKINTLTTLTTLVVLFGIIGIIISNELIQNAFITIYGNLSELISKDSSTINPYSSEGTRLMIWSQIIEILQQSPLTGTGFAGASLVVPGTGSAHNQYMDVLLRNGLIGLVLYLFLWIKVLRFYKKVNITIFAGLLAMFFYGIFHETTKLTYGEFIFFILLSKMYNYNDKSELIS